jgi:hypothetical protein
MIQVQSISKFDRRQQSLVNALLPCFVFTYQYMFLPTDAHCRVYRGGALDISNNIL